MNTDFGRYLGRIPWWLAVGCVLAYGLFVSWDTGEVIISAWKASLLSNLGILIWQLVERRRGLMALQVQAKSKHVPSPRSSSLLFLCIGFLFLASLVIIAHAGTFQLVIMFTFSGDKALWGRVGESLSDFSTLAILPFSLWMTMKAAANGIKVVRLWEHSVRLFLVVWLCFGITLLNMALISGAFWLFGGEAKCSSCASIVIWLPRISYFLGIYLFLSIPPEKIWSWSEKYLKVSPRASMQR